MNCEHEFTELLRCDSRDGEKVVDWCKHCGTSMSYDIVDNRKYNIKQHTPDIMMKKTRVGKFKSQGFKIGNGTTFYINSSDVDKEVAITDTEIHHTYGKRHKVYGYNEWFEENCFDYIRVIWE